MRKGSLPANQAPVRSCDGRFGPTAQAGRVSTDVGPSKHERTGQADTDGPVHDDRNRTGRSAVVGCVHSAEDCQVARTLANNAERIESRGPNDENPWRKGPPKTPAPVREHCLGG